MKWHHWLILLGIAVLYLILRLSFLNTIQFGYDQPILASLVSDFLKNPSFLNSFNFVNFNPWGYPSWGPMQIFFFTSFVLLSKNPIVISVAVAVFNLASVLFVFYIGKKYFSVWAGLVAALILATQPWWVVFSRMIYEPSPVPTLIAICIFLTFYILDNLKSKLIMLLLFIYAFIFQIYVHTISFIVPGIVAVIWNFKKMPKKYLSLGIILALLLFLPVAVYFSANKSSFFGFENVSQKFSELRDETPYSIKDIAYEFFGSLGGGRFKWELGYGFDDFAKAIKNLRLAEISGMVFATVVIFYNLVRLPFDKKTRVKRLLLILWTTGPIFFLTLIRAPIALPRYFLLSLPPFSLLIGILISELSNKFKKISFVFLLIPVLVSFWWTFFIFRYYAFIENYDYKNGFLSSYSDPPFYFLDQSFKWILSDAKTKGYSQITISNDIKSKMSFNFNRAQTYYWDYYLEKNENISEQKIGHYMMYYRPMNEKTKNFKIFGPYVVYEYSPTNIKN